MHNSGCLSFITILIGLFWGVSGIPANDDLSVSPPPIPELYNILWSTQEIACGEKITADMVALIPTPLDGIPSSPILYLERVVGKYTMQDIPKNVQVFYATFSDTPINC